ncbi:hypothetical protein KY358_05345 [Candidatus Woesearchaeota archaeon]|nr:hypothetical protein [Candidatus Woesearchaeota archaeon]
MKKKHLIYIALIIILVLGAFYSFLDTSTLRSGDRLIYYLPRFQILKESVQEYHDFETLWNPYHMGGMPLAVKPAEITVYDNLLGIMVLILPTPLMALKFGSILTYILGGIGMYFLVYYLTKKHEAAFLSSIVFMFNGFAFKIFQWGWLSTMNAMLFSPLIILFTIKAYKTKKWLFYSVIVAVLFALQIRAGTDLKVFMWLMLVFGLYAPIFLLGKNLQKRAVKSVLIITVVGLLVFALSAQKILPIKEYMGVSVKKNLSYEESASRRLKINDLFSRLVQPLKNPFVPRKKGVGDHIGIMAFLLACYGVYKKRKDKNVIFFSAAAILSLFLATGSFVYYFIWKYIPPFSSARYVDRSLVMFVFAGSVLAGYGLKELAGVLKKKFSLGKIKAISWVLIGLVFLNLAVFSYSPYRVANKERNIKSMIDNNEIMQYISKQPGLFRIDVFETKGIDWGTEYTTVPLGIENIFGYTNIWLQEYMNEFLGIAWNSPAKFWGIMNAKYVTSQQELNLTGLKFIKRFNECEECFPDEERIHKVYGPYLHENLEFVPRAFVAGNSILVAGDKEAAKQTMYALLLNKDFNPKSTVVALKEGKVEDIEFLKKFDAVFLTQGSVDQNSIYLLQSYLDGGGSLYPNVVKGENQLSEDKVNALLKSLNKSSVVIDEGKVKTIKFSRKQLELPGQEGFLVMSEKYSITPGWSVLVDGDEKEILRVNGVVSSVYVGKEEKEADFIYCPRSYFYGKVISIAALLLILGYFLYLIIYGRLSKLNRLSGN